MKRRAGGSPVDEPVHGLSRIAIVTLGLLTAFGPLSMDVYLPSLPRIAGEFTASDGGVQLTLSACLLGLAVGQLIIGPLSDRIGRRRPLLLGLAGFAAMSTVCAVAPNLWFLVVARLLQGFCGASGIVLSRAVVRDLCPPEMLAHVYSLLLVVFSVAPVLGPLLGSGLLIVMSWRGVFVVMAAIGVALYLLTAQGLPESLPPERRHRGGIKAVGRAMQSLRHDRSYVGACVVLAVGGLPFFTYLALGSFVLQNEFGLSAGEYAIVFAANALALTSVGRLNVRLVRRFPPETLLGATLVSTAAASALVYGAVTAGWGLPVLLPALLVAVAGIGLVNPNGTAIAMASDAANAGTAAALLGTLTFATGALAGPLASVASISGRTMGIVMVASAVLAVLLSSLLLGRRSVALRQDDQPVSWRPGETRPDPAR